MTRYSKIVSKRRKRGRSFLPDAMQGFLARRLIDGAGAACLIGGAALLLTLASYHRTDPSFDTATIDSRGIANWLGLPGAYLADLVIQVFGFAGAVPALVLFGWGGALLARRGIAPIWRRLMTLALAMLLLGAALAVIPGAGGHGGALLLDGAARHFGRHPWIARGGVAGPALLLGMVCLIHAAALRFSDLVFAWRAAVPAAAAAMATARNWIVHHNRPQQPARALIRRVPAAARIEPPRDPEDTRPEPAPPAKVPVVKTKKKVAVAETNQTKFALEPVEPGDWQFPPLSLLQPPPAGAEDEDDHDETLLRRNADMLSTVLRDFNVQGDIVAIHPGPVVTLYELEPAPGIKSSRVISLSDDIARSMSAISVRSAVVPGRNVIGVELPNRKRQTVFLRTLLDQHDRTTMKQALPLVLGKDIGGKPVVADLARMPHLLVAGTTGSGKSVAVNTMILSLLYSLPPEKCRFIMIDPKMLELSVYDDIPHLLSPVVTEPGKAVVALKWAVHEMEERYRAMSKLGVRNIDGYNERLRAARKKGETLLRKVQTGYDPDTGKPVFEDQPLDTTELPYIVVIVDEFADLMLVAGKDVENAVQRLAQMARAAGIHLIMATQRPSVDVITGVIKANFPTRISFQVTSKVDSRTILNEGGAEQLLGMGDMLYMASGGRVTRVHGPFVADEDVEEVVRFLKSQGEPAYIDEVTDGTAGGDSEVMGALFGGGEGGEGAENSLYDQAVAIVARERKASTSFIQRHLNIGYNRAAKLIEQMEKQGVVGPANHVGKREVLVGNHYSDA